MKDLLDFKLKDMNDYIKTIGGEVNNNDRIRINNPSYMKTHLIFNNEQNINLNNIDNTNFLSYKVENIEKKVNKIKNDVNDIKLVVYKLNDEIIKTTCEGSLSAYSKSKIGEEIEVLYNPNNKNKCKLINAIN